MAWTDYKIAFDSVPRSWILASLDMYRARATITGFVEYSMKTDLMLYHHPGFTKTDKMSIKRGIFQGALTLLPNMLNRLNIGYKIESNQQTSHLLYKA